MKINEIRESGMIEYYVLGLLTDEDVKKVEGFLMQYPELRRDYLEIQASMQAYAKSMGIQPKNNLEDAILKEIKKSGDKTPIEDDRAKKQTDVSSVNTGSSGLFRNLLMMALGLAALFFAWKANNTNSTVNDLQSQYAILENECDSLKTIQLEKISTFEKLNSTNNKSINITPTEGYQETNLLFHFNNADKQNYIQIKSMPEIATNQAFQLWSLKEGVDPIPLTIFKQSGDLLIPVDHEEGTGTYAITIEDENGATSPTLSRLIGTISVA